MHVKNLIDALQTIAPLELAEPWDKVGLQLGRTSRPIDGPILLTIDLTEPVLEEALAARASAIIAYHPPIWEPLRRITDATPKERILARAIQADIAVYAPHTSLDNAPGCMTDWLCEGVSGSTATGRIAGDCRALAPMARRRSTQECKIVTFVPEKEVECVRNALATAGAGLIGKYSVCSFATPGTGTFFASDDASPAIGQAGKLEQIQEVRLEMVCSRSSLPLVIATLRQFHPYEEPAVDVYELGQQPDRTIGGGRRVVLDQPATLEELANRLKKYLTLTTCTPTIQVARAPGGQKSVTHVGVVCGAGAAQAAIARQEGCEVFITGEMKHHEVLEAINCGMSIILAGHTATERGYLPRLARRLKELLPSVEFTVSSADTDPLRSM
ncbi:MAG TPA: Nif3-like dinuclear metal center hexameric protein [Phycisphaerales bacterium]|nr:Nif3-like dinuclear metal center hexameric protein [Phycisphaerales bacterium]